MARRRSLELPSDSPPDISSTAGAHNAEDILQRLSIMCSPVLVPRNQAATVNADAADRGSETPQHAFRRLDSLDTHAPAMGSPAGQPLSPSSRMDSLGTPSVHGVANAALLWTESRRELEVSIHREKTRDHENWEPDVLSQEARLQKRLAKLRLEMAVMAGDGNCMFRAISHDLWATPRYHSSVRRKAVCWMREHSEDFAPFLGESFEGYAAAMSRDGTWGDELTLRAVSDVFGIIVNVVTSDQHNWFQRYKPELIKVPREVFLSYIAPVHYNGIRKRNALRALRPSLSLTRQSLIQAALDKAAAEEREIVALPEHPRLRAQRESAEAAATAAVAAVNAEAKSGNNGAASPAGAPSTPTVRGSEHRGRRGPLQSVAERPSCEGAPEALTERPELPDPGPNHKPDLEPCSAAAAPAGHEDGERQGAGRAAPTAETGAAGARCAATGSLKDTVTPPGLPDGPAAAEAQPAGSGGAATGSPAGFRSRGGSPAAEAVPAGARGGAAGSQDGCKVHVGFPAGMAPAAEAGTSGASDARAGIQEGVGVRVGLPVGPALAAAAGTTDVVDAGASNQEGHGAQVRSPAGLDTQAGSSGRQAGGGSPRNNLAVDPGGAGQPPVDVSEGLGSRPEGCINGAEVKPGDLPKDVGSSPKGLLNGIKSEFDPAARDGRRKAKRSPSALSRAFRMVRAS